MARRRKKSSAKKTQWRVPQHPRIALIGFRGIGKTAIARRLAELWQMPLCSLDEQIEKKQQLTIEQIVQNQGWPYFRELEYQELLAATTQEKLLLDCGGGIVEEADGSRSERKLALLRDHFFCIYITASEDKILQRLQNLARNASRPALPQSDSPEALLQVFRRREPWYLEVADAVVDVSDTIVPESVQRIAQLFK
ncbi:MAG: shikimate kinase [Leptospiraceae bacterium]|nr:shikimate kinase [Leptospiraceae bacterium]